MRVVRKYPGLCIEPSPSGKTRYRVRVEGDKKRRIRLLVPPGHPDFDRQYWDARAGIRPLRNDPVAAVRATGDFDRILKEMLRGARSRALARGRDFSLTEQHVLGMLEQQDGRCAMSGIAFDLKQTAPAARRPFAPSIDRIDSAGGYVRGNVRIVCTIVNTGRADWSDDDYIKTCKAVAERYTVAQSHDSVGHPRLVRQ